MLWITLQFVCIPQPLTLWAWKTKQKASNGNYFYHFTTVASEVGGSEGWRNWRDYVFSLFIWLHQIVAVALGIVSLCCGMWDLVLQPGIQPRPPALRVRSAGHWTAWDVPKSLYEPLNKSFKWQGTSCSIPELWGITWYPWYPHKRGRGTKRIKRRKQDFPKRHSLWPQKSATWVISRHTVGKEFSF